MSKERRAALNKIFTVLEAKANSLGLEETRNELEVLKDDEQEAFDNLPEDLQQGERGAQMKEAIDQLEEATSKLQEAEDALKEALDAIDSASAE